MREDRDGTTSQRQQKVLHALYESGIAGLTWKDLSDQLGWHHGQASGALSVLHKSGHIERLSERRNRCSIYVLSKYVNGRDTERHGSRSVDLALRSKIRALLQTTMVEELDEEAPEHWRPVLYALEKLMDDG